MHLLIPFAFCSSEGCATALHALQLPRLAKLLSRLTPQPLDQGDASSLSTPHERALARALGLGAADGLLPWAALDAMQTQAAPGGWGFITPCHWQFSNQHVAMSGSPLADFSALESQTLLATMQPYFEEDGIALHYHQPTCWLARSDAFETLATASLDRVAGRPVADWLPSANNAAKLLRLQSEMQMLLYNHPLNEARIARGLAPVNSFWLSGTGALHQPLRQPAMNAQPLVVSGLRAAALSEDWGAWAQAWSALDASECAALLKTLDQDDSVQLTLCGERNAQTFEASRTRNLKRFMRLFGTRPASKILLQL